MKNKKFLFICKDAGSLINFRGDLIRALEVEGFSIIAICNNTAKPALASELKRANIELRYAGYQSKNPLVIFYSVLKIKKIIREVQPEIILSYTLVATIFGSFAALFAHHKNFFSLVTGRGILFTVPNIFSLIRKHAVVTLLRIIYPFNKKILFQNKDDASLFVDLGILPKDKVNIISGGSGVNMRHFFPTALPPDLVFLTIARLLKHKGLYEYALAAKAFLKIYPSARFLIAGSPDQSPDHIPLEEVQNLWPAQYGTEYIGYYDDVRDAVNLCSVFVLLSHHEGLPRSSIEAMAMGRPILTTNAPGCNETIENNRNGFLVDVNNPEAAFHAMKKFTEPNVRAAMGKESIAICKNKFDVDSVNDCMLKILDII
ncbi:glycosyltransferase family 4 protein [Gammaproteobacteria bacterium]|nr:glycosyltransferase family 4 protein [Gammaproteobacteria bacterium]